MAEPILESISTTQVRLLREAMRRFPKSTADSVRKRYEQNAKELVATMRLRSTIGPLFKKTGRLGRSWSDNVGGGSRLQGITGEVNTFDPKAHIHEVGGTRYPRQGNRRIWIPVAPNLKPNRTAKVSPTAARQKIEDGVWRIRAGRINERGLQEEDVRSQDKIFVLNEKNELVFVLIKKAHYKAQLGFRVHGQSQVVRLTRDLNKDADAYWAEQLRKIGSAVR